MANVVQHYNYLGDTTIEEIIEVDYDARTLKTTHNILPNTGVSQPSYEEEPPVVAPPLMAAPPPEEEPTYTGTERAKMGGIRAMWYSIFAGVGEGVNFLAENITGVGLPPGVSTGIGAGLYAMKRALWPDTTL